MFKKYFRREFWQKHREPLEVGIVSGIISGLLVTYLFQPTMKQVVSEILAKIRCPEIVSSSCDNEFFSIRESFDGPTVRVVWPDSLNTEK